MVNSGVMCTCDMHALRGITFLGLGVGMESGTALRVDWNRDKRDIIFI